MLNPAGAASHSNWGDSTANGPNPAATHSVDAQLKVEKMN
jgi:hypothetical protein